MKEPFKKSERQDNRYVLKRPVSADEIIEMAMSIMRSRFRRGSSISSPEAMRQFLQLQLSPLDHEVFCAVYLDNRHRVLAFEQIFRGTIDGASIHPREVVKLALSYGAAASVLVHNHPSGIAEPSHADRAITIRLRDALALVDVRVLDHVVISGGESVSFAERGLL